MEWIKRKAAKICARTGNIREAAESCNVRKETICQWKKDPEFQKLMKEEEKKKESILDAHQDGIDKALCFSAKIRGKDGTGDRRLYYQKRGQLVEKREGTFRGEIVDITNMTDEEIDAQRRKLLADISSNPGKSRTPSD